MKNEKIYTPSELNKLAQEIDKKCRESKSAYPMKWVPNDGKTGQPVPVLLQMTPVGEPKVIDYNYKDEATGVEFIFKCKLQTYEWYDEKTKEMKRITMPVLGAMPLPESYSLTADMMEASDGQRKFTSLNTMCNALIQNSPLRTLSFLLADSLSEEPGISTLVESILAESHVKSGSTLSQNLYIKEYETSRVVAGMKEKYWSSLNNQYIGSCRTIAKILKENNIVESVTKLESTGIVPTILNEPNIAVNEIGSQSKPPVKNDPLKGFLSMPTNGSF